MPAFLWTTRWSESTAQGEHSLHGYVQLPWAQFKRSRGNEIQTRNAPFCFVVEAGQGDVGKHRSFSRDDSLCINIASSSRRGHNFDSRQRNRPHGHCAKREGRRCKFSRNWLLPMDPFRVHLPSITTQGGLSVYPQGGLWRQGAGASLLKHHTI